MERVLFMQSVKPGCEDEYVHAHGHAPLWPDVAAACTAAGMQNYTGFIGGPDGRVVIGYFETPSLRQVQQALADNPVNAEWSKLMVPMMEVGGDLTSESMPFLRPVWRID